MAIARRQTKVRPEAREDRGSSDTCNKCGWRCRGLLESSSACATTSADAESPRETPRETAANAACFHAMLV